MSLEIKGRIYSIGNTQQVNDKFKKREFILEIVENINGNVYKNYAKMQTVQAKTDLLDRYSVGEDVNVHFNIKGNLWQDSAITNLDVWKIQSAQGNVPHPAPAQQQQPASNNIGGNPDTPPVDDLPF